MKSEFIFNQPDDDYRSAKPELSQTVLKNIQGKSPAHAWEAMRNSPDTATMKLGRAAHCYILEGKAVFNSRYAVAPDCNRRTKLGKDNYADFVETLGDREVISADDMLKVEKMAAALSTNGLTKQLFVGGSAEVSAFGQIDGTEFKGRFDYYHPTEQVIIDLKTCVDASPDAVKKYVLNYGLHIQQYCYSALHKDITGNLPADFVFVMVEKSAPYGVAVFRIEPEAIEAAKLEVFKGLAIYRDCLASGVWPSYPETVQSINLPAWYYKQAEAAQ